MRINDRMTFRISLLFSLDLAPLGEITNTDALFSLKFQWLCINLFIQVRK